MKMIIKWDNLDIVYITRQKGVYIYNLDVDNFKEAVDKGMSKISLLEVPLISKKLPKFIENRIPPKKIRDEKLDIVSEDEGINILRYIELTKCVLPTDKIQIILENNV